MTARLNLKVRFVDTTPEFRELYRRARSHADREDVHLLMLGIVEAARHPTAPRASRLNPPARVRFAASTTHSHEERTT